MSTDKNSSNLSDLKLVQAIKKGDSKALDDLLELYIPQLNAFFHYIHVSEDSVEDLIQETFERMITKIDSFDENKRFSTWLMTIGRNLYIDQYRRRIKSEELVFEEENNSLNDPEEEVVGKISVEELLKNLSDKEKFLIEMRVFKQMPFAEISEVTGETETSLRSRFFRALGHLRSIV
ncbi:MAG: sigma-70 family RNA polymerase sigma factor [Candidatus Riflebacteria bacterium]|nr:sigma-70 family RNA polymerase sigma factor [Candidatus Riflebacteria bacterium]